MDIPHGGSSERIQVATSLLESAKGYSPSNLETKPEFILGDLNSLQARSLLLRLGSKWLA